jgi:molybdopterin-guanine dinucleotide biosynthesis protein A
MLGKELQLINPSDITGLILAGGRGTRMGGVDKGLQNFKGLPLALHALNRLKVGGGVGRVAVNANRHISDYAAFGVAVWPDDLADYAGPLAGFLTGLARCDTPYMVTVPCDTPLFPLDLVPRLGAALVAAGADIAMVAAPERDRQGQMQLRSQPVFCLLKTSLLPSLAKFTAAGGRKIDAWTALHHTVLVPFNLPGDDPQAFSNTNTLDELRQLELP